jgi:hypothetical protein
MGSLIDVVVYDEDQDAELVLLAKIVGETETDFNVKFMSPTKGGLYTYDNDVSVIEKGAVCGYYDSSDERDAGFVAAQDGCFEHVDDDDDYNPSDSDTEDDDDDDDEDLVDEDDEDEIEEC